MKIKHNFQKIFNNLSRPILMIDRDYKIAVINKVACTQQNLSQEKMIGRYCYEATHHNDTPCWECEALVCPVKAVFETGKRAHTIHKHSHNKHVVVEEIVAVPLEEDNGSINYVIEEFEDITELLGLRGNILSICSSCKKICDYEGNWHRVENYFHIHTGADFSHGLCSDCMHRLYPEIADEMEETLEELDEDSRSSMNKEN